MFQKRLAGGQAVHTKLRKDFILSYGAQVLAVCGGLVVFVVLARRLHPEALGLFAVASVIGAVVALAVSLGIDSSCAYFAASEVEARPEVLGATLVLLSIMSTAGIAVSLGVGPILVHYLAGGPDAATFAEAWLLAWDRHRELLVAMALFSAASSAAEVSGGLARGLSLGVYNISVALYVPVWVGLTCYWLVGPSLGVVGALHAQTAASALRVGFVIGAVTARHGVRFPRAGLISRMVRFNLKGYCGYLLEYANFKLLFVVIGYVHGTRVVGIYSLAFGIVDKILHLPLVVGTVLFPHAVERLRAGLPTPTPSMMRRTLAVLVATGGFFAVVGEPLIVLVFGEQYRSAHQVFLLLAPLVVTAGVIRIAFNELTARGRTEVFLYGNLASAAVFAVGAAFLVPLWPYGGAALTHNLCNLVCAVVLMSVVVSLSGVGWREHLVPSPSDFWTLLSRSRGGGVKAM